ncbi:amidase family protein [Burkholderia plantarii]|uniref:amidase family protein n=1 Tax=Burkholderia plantarii TaxID=41899 RepID=UPI0018DDFE3B|nr:amidase family protein [Burkholderia plantarii]MBI0325751.1 amidase [Burkholderia plantarii]
MSTPGVEEVTTAANPVEQVVSADDAPLLALGAREAVAAMRQGEISAERYAGALLAQARRWERVNAFRTLDRDAVLEAARAADRHRAAGGALGALHGLPVPVKDSVNTHALPTSNGTAALAAFRPPADAALVGLLGGAGALVMGKTNLHEISFGWTSNNLTFGAVRNPYALERSPGGSSGGSAAAVATGMAPLAVAEDTWGSIRLPAAFCGLAGFRPSRSRYPDEGIMPLSRRFDRVGPVARRVEDLVLFDQVAARDTRPVAPHPANAIRIGVPLAFWAELDPEVERVAREALARLAEAGVTLVELGAPLDGIERAPEIVGTIVASELRASITEFLARHDAGVSFEAIYAGLGENTRGLMDGMVLPPNAPPADAYETALRDRDALAAMVLARLREQGLHALAFPAAMVQAPRIGEEMEVTLADGRVIDAFAALGRNVALGSCAGMTSLVLPAGQGRDGTPIGLEFAAPAGDDRVLLALGLSLERVLGGVRPPVPGA